ncbi:arsenate reductase (glutaredoxin) [Iamia majanohamensis]|uniref:Arsenate reductase (Glutaredoxin) n=1 Tax=Iamia majanohamensis TaxID=467976 RepID=A0AAF0BT73_9ACTN|nr:arsenate reductase (glutaredoxin) [Iamia majanohamensis]WCO66427.1 arsenate reductase (glutaredoxin) [Iamia majanohamensis]
MSDTVLWHNARCSKSRQAKALLEEEGVDLEVREYLKEPPTRAELEALVDALGLDEVRQVVRTGEDAYAQLGLAEADDDELLDAMVDNPILLERPILVRGDRAVVGRPPEDVRRLL